MGIILNTSSIWNFCFFKVTCERTPLWSTTPCSSSSSGICLSFSPIVDEEVTQVIEEVIGGAEGIKNIDAKSENGKSTINIEFDTDVDLDNAATM